MSKRLPYQRLPLQDRYIGQEHIQTQELPRLPYIERSTPPALPIPHFSRQGVTRRHKLRFWLYPAFFILIAVMIMSGVHYVLTGDSQKDTFFQNLTSSIRIEGQTAQRNTLQKDGLKKVIQTRISQLAKDVDAIKYSGICNHHRKLSLFPARKTGSSLLT